MRSNQVVPFGRAPCEVSSCGMFVCLGEPFKHQVFKQMSHAGLAIIFVPRTDQIGDIDRRRLLCLVGEKQHAKAVRQLVFGDAFHRSVPGKARRNTGCLTETGQTEKEKQQ